MSTVFFASELEGVATYWRVFRRDGVTLGFTSHDRDLWFGGINHRAAPGMLPSAIRKTSDLSDDSAEMTGVLSHDTISDSDLRIGRFDYARIEVGAVDWSELNPMPLYFGSIGQVSTLDGHFSADLRSTKAELAKDIIPRTSPTCRAQFCGPGCGLSASLFTHLGSVTDVDRSLNAVTITIGPAEAFVGGRLRWLDGPAAGQRTLVMGIQNNNLILADTLPPAIAGGVTVELLEGCDHRLDTCGTRFANAINFQAEPFLPGNDLLVRGPTTP
ncbi:DUF2163 domain-containing protein [Altererythrobacter sp. RZ02]|uniref:DUF2163 domain-containing protein n=1 Tax=Pontixanthobacter rizhaonensis TaxID=2730337 RepID=A0A848QRV0_9SPHN|nr:DUF2163 domain-containing protein [Pontixanthobacter rizhaonensis]